MGRIIERRELLDVVELKESAIDAAHGPLQEPIASLLNVDGSAKSVRIKHAAV
jgi:hypothetical protein